MTRARPNLKAISGGKVSVSESATSKLPARVTRTIAENGQIIGYYSRIPGKGIVEKIEGNAESG